MNYRNIFRNMETFRKTPISLLIWISFLVLNLTIKGEAITQRLVRKVGESLKVTCPEMPSSELRALSVFKHNDKSYTTIYSKMANNPLREIPGSGSVVSLDKTQRTMTVSKLSMKDDGMTFTCKLVSLGQEKMNSVYVTIVVPPSMTIKMSPQPPYANKSSVTVTCEIDKVNPAIRGDKITLKMGNTRYDVTKVRRNPDMTWKYSNTKSFYVTKTRDDRKLVSCEVMTEGHVKRVVKSKRLEFIRPPKGMPYLTASSTVIRKGEELLLHCQVKDAGVPAANIYQFYQNGVLVKRNGPYSKLTVIVTSSINAGSYTCKAANSEGASSFSNSICVAYTTIPLPGKGIPTWVSVVSILLNIGALVYFCMYYVKPRVLKLVEDWKAKRKGKLYAKDGFVLNKEESKAQEKAPIGVKVMYDDKTPFEFTPNQSYPVSTPIKSQREKSDDEDEIVPAPLPAQEARPPQTHDPTSESYEDMRL